MMDKEAVSIDAWQLKHLAQALTRAKRLEALRTGFHKELYQCIAYSTTNFDTLNPKGISTATDSQAIRIIEAKERYDRLIMNEYDKHIRWKILLGWLQDSDKLIVIRYFQKKKYVRPEVITSLLHRISKSLAEEERHLEKVRTDQAKEEYEAYRKTKIGKRKPKQRVSFYEDGEWIILDADDYELRQRKNQNDQREKEWQRHLKSISKAL